MPLAPETIPTAQAEQAMQVAEKTYSVALSCVIDCPEMMGAAGDELRSIAAKRRELEETRLSITRPIRESEKRINELFRKPDARLAEAEAVLRRGMLEYQQAERAKAEEARRQADAAAAAERAALERKRQQAEAAARKEQETADTLAADGDDGKAETAFEAAAQAQQHAEAAAVQAEIAAIAPVHVPAAAPAKVTGISTRKNWRAEIVDENALIAAAMADATYRGLVVIDTAALNKLARALGANARIPGVRVYAEESLAVRRA